MCIHGKQGMANEVGVNSGGRLYSWQWKSEQFGVCVEESDKLLWMVGVA